MCLVIDRNYEMCTLFMFSSRGVNDKTHHLRLVTAFFLEPSRVV